jgi:hypothetical protein
MLLTPVNARSAVEMRNCKSTVCLPPLLLYKLESQYRTNLENEIMSVGNTINYSVPVVGTTVETFDRSNGNAFYVAYTQAGGSYPATLNLRPASALSVTKKFGVSVKLKPSEQDDPGVITKGSATISFNVDAIQGSVLTKAEICELARYALSCVLHTSLLEDLYDGVSL